MSAPLTANASAFEFPALPMPWVERIFQRLHGRFGNGFLDKYRTGQQNAEGVDLGIVNAKTIWAEELAGYSPDEIKAALAARYAFPPSLDEFQKAARPQLDLHALMLVAIREMANRRNRMPENWPDCRTFWAAQRIGSHDMLSVPPEKLQKRFELAWFEAHADKDKPIPQPSDANALPAPGKATISAEEARQRASQIGLQLNKADNTRKWAMDIASNPKNFQRNSIEGALKALQVWGIEWPQALIDRAHDVGLSEMVA